MANLDVLFIHPPRNFRYLKSNSKRRGSFLVFPMGLISMADLLAQEGYSTKILNFTLEYLLDRKFSLLQYLKKTNPKVVGVDLHWILHSPGAIDVLQFVKKHFPDTFTLLGGYSATYYAKEIMQNYDFVDGIIQGDGEIPIIQLIKHPMALDQVPNLMYRQDRQIKDNSITYVTQELDSLNFGKVQYVEHWKEYLETIYNKLHFPFPLEVTRGCPFNCIFCGGGRYSERCIFKRKNVIFRSPKRVVDDIKEYVNLTHADGIFFGHGVYPATEPYFMEIQKLIREEGLKLRADLEVWRLPLSKKFVQDFIQTYSVKKSVIWFSVRNFSEPFRKKIDKWIGKFDNAFAFSDTQLNSFLDLCKAAKLRVMLFYDLGNPFETISDAVKNILNAFKIALLNCAKKRRVAIMSESVQMSPGCPADLFDKKLGLQILTKTFLERQEWNQKTPWNLSPWDVSVNYRTKNLSQRELNFLNRLVWMGNYMSFMPFFLL